MPLSESKSPSPCSAAADPAAANVRAALALLSDLLRRGVELAVLCPGSRSAPLAQAAALLEPRGLRLLTAIDERSAAFFALGHGKATGQPAAVITTSGTAVAQLLPAAVEADLGTVPLLLLSADRPARLKNCGANQSVPQEQFLAVCCRWVGLGAGAGLATMSSSELQAMAARAMAAARGDGLGAIAGAVHLNLPFEEPLHIAAAGLAALALDDAPELLAQGPLLPAPLRCRAEPMAAQGPAVLDPDRPGVVVAGPWRGDPLDWPRYLEALRLWLRRSGWPLLADPLSGLRGLEDLPLVGAYDLILAAPPAELAVDQVLRLGSLPASRRLQQWLQALGGDQVLVSQGDSRRLDPLGTVPPLRQSSAGLEHWLATLPGLDDGAAAAEPAPACLALRRRWCRADATVQGLLDQQLQVPERLGEVWLARSLSRLLPPHLALMLASSSPVRDWESFADPAAPPRRIHGFRGASGIDGTLSMACGLAEAHGQLVLISGDLALLHDANGWLWQRQLRGRLTVVLIENGGGGIFEQLPIRIQPPVAMDFERLFAMPQAVEQLDLAAAYGVAGRRVERPQQLAAALAWALRQPMALLELRTDRRADAALRTRLRTMACRQLPLP
ncbi:MAG: 2-succinyl-5-enolpyruvyl-6-hydroxy-3-cyclohexene-1-carboxylic-acid synthase [Cyanobium sp.]